MSRIKINMPCNLALSPSVTTLVLEHGFNQSLARTNYNSGRCRFGIYSASRLIGVFANTTVEPSSNECRAGVGSRSHQDQAMYDPMSDQSRTMLISRGSSIVGCGAWRKVSCIMYRIHESCATTLGSETTDPGYGTVEIQHTRSTTHEK